MLRFCLKSKQMTNLRAAAESMRYETFIISARDSSHKYTRKCAGWAGGVTAPGPAMFTGSRPRAGSCDERRTPAGPTEPAFAAYLASLSKPPSQLLGTTVCPLAVGYEVPVGTARAG